MRKKALLIGCLVCLFVCSSANASIITIGITAVVDNVSDSAGHLEGKISTGDTITGYYVYESDTLDSNPSTNGGKYLYNSGPYGIFLSAGGLTFATNPLSTNFEIRILDNVDYMGISDGFVIQSYSNSNLATNVPVTDFFWQFVYLNENIFSNDALLRTAPMLSDWNSNVLYISGGPRETKFGIYATVTSAEVIPEPLTLSFLGFGVLLLRKYKK